MPKVRQHSQDSSRTASWTGFEGGEVFILNSDLAELLRSVIRSGGRSGFNGPAANRGKGSRNEDGKVRGADPRTPQASTRKAAPNHRGEDGQCEVADGSHPSADEFEEKAAAKGWSKRRS